VWLIQKANPQTTDDEMGSEGKLKTKGTSWKTYLGAAVLLLLCVYFWGSVGSLSHLSTPDRLRCGGAQSDPGTFRLTSGSLPPEDLQLVTWNMAAINNNPFEYWITHHDQARLAAAGPRLRARPPFDGSPSP
jgi:hypothetical protein